MTKITFSQKYYYDGADDDHRPVVVVRLFPTAGPPLTVNAILDTGAECSVFSKGLASHLGITDITDGAIRTVRLQTADNSPERHGFVHEIDVEWLGYRFPAPIAFVREWPDDIDNLIGMQGFFDELLIAFHHQQRTVYVNPYGAAKVS